MVHNKLLLVAYNLKGPGPVVSNPADATTMLEKLISNTVGLLTIIAAIYFLFQIIFAGYQFFSTDGDKNKMESARKKILDNILGLIIVVIAFGLTAFFAKVLGLGNIFDLNTFIQQNAI